MVNGRDPLPVGEPIPAAILGFLGALLALLLLAVMIQHAQLHADCGVPVGESCGTDTECECMHGSEP